MKEVLISFFSVGISGAPIIVHQDAGSRPLKSIILHRAVLKQEMLDIFKDPTILEYDLDVTIISHNGNEEGGKGTGVVREVLATFWDQCFNSLTVGAFEKVPNIRHDHQKAEWEAIGRIITYGYSVVRYFPITLSRAFVATVLFGEESLTPDLLIEAFKLYVSSEERVVIDKSLRHECNPDDEDLVEFLGSFKCYKIPTKGNIKTIMHELAHQEIVQKPRYVVDCLAPILNALRVYPHFQTLEALINFYNAKKPSSKKVIKLLSANPQSPPEQNSFDHFKRYIKNLEGNALGNFLQFLTGSDIIVCDTISVTFTALDGMARRPVVHTCGPTLELPTTYQSYNELAEEFTSIVRDQQAWSFNIV